jgi:hypothetical protein
MFSRKNDPATPKPQVPEPYREPLKTDAREHSINLIEQGVRLPTDDQWVDVPGSPFQVMTRGTDEVGTLWIRLNPNVTWEEWGSFQVRLEERYREYMKSHPLGKLLGYT